MATGLPAGTKLGRYEVVKHLARGGMADLSVARATGIENFERHVVIKHLRPEQSNDAAFVQMFVTEARLAGVLHHHNIVQVHDIGQSDGRHFFAMEYVHGEDLRHLLVKLCDRAEHLPIQHVVTIATAVCAALHHAHEQKGADRKPLGIVHRDVTPANILVGYDGNVKVVDFGIAKAVLRTSDTAAGMLKGKVPYMAPEQCTGKPIDRRSDVFAFGVVLYELVTVRRLFKGANEYLTMAAVVSGEIPRPSTHRKDLPLELENIILKALARDPARRFQTADEMRLALDRFADQAGLRTSTTALADYMKQLFGERPEPWMVDISPAVVAPVDFDKTDVGIVEVPADAVEEIDVPKAAVAGGGGGTLLDQARRHATPVKAIPSLTGRKTPPPVVPAKRPANPDTEPVQVAPIVPVEPATAPAASAPPPVPPAPPPVPAATRATPLVADEPDDEPDVEPDVEPDAEPPAPERESTEIVKPLAIPPGDLTTMTRAPAADRKWLYFGGVAVAALGIAIAIMLTGRSVDSKSPPAAPVQPETAKTEPVADPPKPATTEPVADPPKSETTPVEPTRPVETKTTPPPPPDEPTPVETKPVETTPPVETKPVETTPPVETKPVETKPPIKKPVVRKPVTKPPVKPGKKPPPKPQWDPDTLFLPKKK